MNYERIEAEIVAALAERRIGDVYLLDSDLLSSALLSAYMAGERSAAERALEQFHQAVLAVDSSGAGIAQKVEA